MQITDSNYGVRSEYYDGLTYDCVKNEEVLQTV
jgi:hypothetical protein